LTAFAYKISRDHDWLAALDAVGEISGKKLGERRNAFRDALDQSSCAGPAPNVARNAGSTQYAISVATSFRKGRDAKCIDISGSGRLTLSGRSGIRYFYHGDTEARSQPAKSGNLIMDQRIAVAL